MESNHLAKDLVSVAISLFADLVDYFPYIDNILLLLIFGHSIILTDMRALFNFVAAKFFAKETEANPARIPPQTPPAGGKRAEAKRKILSPRKTDFRFAESALKPHALPEYLYGQNPERKTPFPFSKEISPPPNQKCKECFFFRGCWRTRQCVGLVPSVRFSFASPRTRSVRHHLF